MADREQESGCEVVWNPYGKRPDFTPPTEEEVRADAAPASEDAERAEQASG